ncbi:MAG: hypothetical protein IPO90_08540 [Flavobacteriales bacterium]|nr:hypothetical protein [Flavobacteriales bacterium]
MRSQERNACDCLYKAYKALGRGSDAPIYHERYTALGDSLRSGEVEKQLQRLEFKRKVLADSPGAGGNGNCASGWRPNREPANCAERCCGEVGW